MGNKVYKYMIYDYSGSEKIPDKEDEDEWKQKIKHITSCGSYEAEILKSTIYCMPLKGLGGLHIDEIGENRGVKHCLVIFECMKDDGQNFFLSFEKDRKGITVQYSQNKDELKENKRGKKRKEADRVNELVRGYYNFTSPINELIGLRCPKIMRILERWRTVPDYNVFNRNCQDLVEDVQKIFRDISSANAMKVKFPRFDETVRLSVEDKTEKKRIINLYERYSEECMIENNMGKLPRIIGPKDDFKHVAKEEDIERLKKNAIKEKLDDLIDKCLKNRGIYFSHLNANKMEMNLKDATKLTNAKSNEISTFWDTEIDGIILSEDYGVILVDIADDNNDNGKQRRDGAEELIKRLVNIVSEKDEDITRKKNITIQVTNEELESPCKIVGENCIQIEKSRVGIDISEEFHNLLDKILKKSKKNFFTFTNEPQRKFLAALLLIFQNMEKVDAMLFKCITNQNWDTGCNYIVWSREQRDIINKIELAFNEDPRKKTDDTKRPLCEFIFGCPGSGKTLILLYACKEYCKRWPDANVLFIIQNQYTGLLQHIATCLEDLEGRVKIQHDLTSVKLVEENIGLIVIDEFYVYMIDNDGYEKTIKSVSTAGIHMLFASMDIQEKYLDEDLYNKHILGGANYRSNEAILQLVRKVQRSEGKKSKRKETMRVDSSPFMYSSNYLVHLKYMIKDGYLRKLNKGETSIEGDTSCERTGFINECVNYIIDQIKNKSLLAAGKVLIYNICHFNIFLRIKEEIRNKSANGELTDVEYNNLVFSDTRASQGAQYAYSIGIYDHSSIPYTPQKAMITALTRTLMSVHLLINMAKHPPYRLPLQNQPIPQCIVFDDKFGTSQLGNILKKIRHKKERITVLFDTEDSSIAIDQIDAACEIKAKARNNRCRHPTFDYSGDVDVIIGSSYFYSIFNYGCSSIHSRDVPFVVTYTNEEREDAKMGDFDEYKDKNRTIEELLIEFNQTDMSVTEIYEKLRTPSSF